MSAPPSRRPTLIDAESEKSGDLDRPKMNGRKDLSKSIMVPLAIVVALSTIVGAWMVVRLSIHSKAEAVLLDDKRSLAVKDSTPIPENRSEEVFVAATPASIMEARPDPTTPARTPEEKQKSVSIDRTPAKAEPMPTAILSPPTEPEVVEAIPPESAIAESTPVPQPSISAASPVTIREVNRAEEVVPEPPQSRSMDGGPGITAFGTLNPMRQTGVKREIWDRTAEAQPVESRSVDPPDSEVTERQLNEIYTKVRSRLGTLAKQKLKLEELKWLRQRESINSHSDAFVAFTQERIRVLNDMQPENER
jgi:hypothetical protein